MLKRDNDDVVSIRRDSISGRARVRYGSTIRDMHFGSRQICRSVSRSAWSAQMQERGLVYCDSGQCILVPTVCRNVSRIARPEVANERAEGEPPAPEGPPVAAVVEPQPAPLPFDVAAPLPEFDAGPSFESSRGGPGFGGGGGFGVGSASGSAAIGRFSGGAQASPPDEVPHALADTRIPGAIAPVPEPETGA